MKMAVTLIIAVLNGVDAHVKIHIMKTHTGLTITINGEEPNIHSEGRIEVTSEKLLENEVFNKPIKTKTQ